MAIANRTVRCLSSSFRHICAFCLGALLPLPLCRILDRRSARLLRRAGGRGAFLVYWIMILVEAFMHESDWFIVRDGEALFRLIVRPRAWISEDYLNTQIVLSLGGA